MKLRSQRLMPFLKVVALTFISFFFILMTQTIYWADQPKAAAVVYAAEGDDADILAGRILDVEHRAYTDAVCLYFEDRLTVEGRMVRIRQE